MLHIMMNARFIKLCSRLGIDTSFADEYQFLFDAYTQPGRYYHNLGHIEACLDDFQDVASLTQSPELIEFAIWYHDVVYDVNLTDNEARSADRALVACAEFGLSEEQSQEIETLILATMHDVVPQTDNQRIITDVDLAILGRAEHQYESYEIAIRKEYSHVPENVFCAGRICILRAFLARSAIYSLPHFQDKYELQARSNIEKAIARLS